MGGNALLADIVAARLSEKTRTADYKDASLEETSFRATLPCRKVNDFVFCLGPGGTESPGAPVPALSHARVCRVRNLRNLDWTIELKGKDAL